MRKAAFLGAVLALALAGGASAQRAGDAFVVRDGAGLSLKGKPYRFTGINVYNANSTGLCWYAMASGPLLGEGLKELGKGHVIRAWFTQELATTSGARDWSAFDHTLAVARERATRVIVTLGNQWGDCDVQEGFKDEAWYAGGYQLPRGSNPASYRDFVAEVVARYRDDPTVLMWQLLNEAEAPASPSGPCLPTAATTLRTWAADVSALVKSLDPNHLVSVGTIGSGQCGTNMDEYKQLHALPGVDLCEIHDYSPDPFSGDVWNGVAVRVQQCAELGKPLFVGETGLIPNAVGGLQARADAFGARIEAHFAAGFVGELVWAWSALGSTLDNYDIGPGDPALKVLRRYRG
jgi:endo-1,4-beta-mannosidase